uniref:Putative ovule protein n=1 Tax=Solanum chacoense TaxID=4108 RepID=A0A0V0IFM8_SOLCH
MNDGMFLFEFPSRKTSEHVMEGEWSWRRMPLKLLWWKPTTGCWPAEIRRDWVWIRVLGIPLNLWSEEIFKLIGERYRGFIETEEETTLKNHLHWASIKVKGDGARVPREIKVNSEGFVYQIPIWCETPVTVKKEETKKEGSRYCPEDNREHESFLVKEVTFPQHESFLVKEVTFPQLSHVGTSKEGGFLKIVTHGKGERTKGQSQQLWAKLKEQINWAYWTQLLFSNIKALIQKTSWWT